MAPGLSAILALPHYGRVARHSGIIPRSPPVGREGGHFNVVARRGALGGASAIGALATRDRMDPLTAPIWPVSQGSFWQGATRVAAILRSCTEPEADCNRSRPSNEHPLVLRLVRHRGDC